MAYQKKYELFLPHWFSDYLWQTRGMSFEEKGVFVELRDTYWMDGCEPMSLADLHIKLGCKKALVAKVIEKARGVDTEDGTHIKIPALDQQRQKALKFSEKQASRRKGALHLRCVPPTNE